MKFKFCNSSIYYKFFKFLLILSPIDGPGKGPRKWKHWNHNFVSFLIKFLLNHLRKLFSGHSIVVVGTLVAGWMAGGGEGLWVVASLLTGAWIFRFCYEKFVLFDFLFHLKHHHLIETFLINYFLIDLN